MEYVRLPSNWRIYSHPKATKTLCTKHILYNIYYLQTFIAEILNSGGRKNKLGTQIAHFKTMPEDLLEGKSGTIAAAVIHKYFYIFQIEDFVDFYNPLNISAIYTAIILNFSVNLTMVFI